MVKENRANVLSFIKAGIISIIVTLGLVLIFALILKLANLSDAVIAPVNLAIKAISIAVGTIILTKDGEGGLKKGIMLGIIFTAFAFVVFSALCGTFNLGFGLVLDMLFGAMVGGIVGILAVNFKKH